jgi:hypothetical protein
VPQFDQDLAHTIAYAIRHKVLGLTWKRDFTNEDFRARFAADKIAEHLRRCGYEFTKKPPLEPWASPKPGPDWICRRDNAVAPWGMPCPVCGGRDESPE